MTTIDRAPILGHVVPRIHTGGYIGYTLGDDLLRFVTGVLKEAADPWQEWWCRNVLQINADGSFRFRTAILLVARQNGKSHLLRWLVLWMMFTGRSRFVLWTSQSLSVSGNMHRQLVDTINRVPALRKRVKSVLQRYEEKSITLIDGTIFRIVASTPDAARSLTVDLLIVDELRTFDSWDGWNALEATTSARPDALTICASNAGDDTSIVLNTFLDRARASVADPDTDTFLAEWSAPDGASTSDFEAIAMANPALGHGRTSMRAITGARDKMPEAGFRTEYMCQRVTALDPAIDWSVWQACSDQGLRLAGLPLYAGYDVALDSRHSTMAVAARLPGGKIGVRILQAWDGPGRPWEHAEASGCLAVAWTGQGPAAAQQTALRGIVGSLELGHQDSVAACMRLADLAASGVLVHPGDPLLDDQVSGSGKARTGDRWCFTRKGAGHVDAVYAIAHAVRSLEAAPKAQPKWEGPLVI